MKDTPYSKFGGEDLILRDKLAIDRTILANKRTLLANERTLLAYLRSGVALLIAGVSIIHFSQEVWFQAIGIVCLPAGLITGLIGVSRYRKINRSILIVRKRSDIIVENGKADEPR